MSTRDTAAAPPQDVDAVLALTRTTKATYAVCTWNVVTPSEEVQLKEWAAELLEKIAPLAALLDQSHGGDAHSKALDAQLAKVKDSSLTPSAQVLAAMAEHKESFAQFSLRQSQAHAEYFRSEPLSQSDQAAFEERARASLAEQVELEQHEVGDFDVFVGAYQASILAISN